MDCGASNGAYAPDAQPRLAYLVAKVRVAGSNPVVRSPFTALCKPWSGLLRPSSVGCRLPITPIGLPINLQPNSVGEYAERSGGVHHHDARLSAGDRDVSGPR